MKRFSVLLALMVFLLSGCSTMWKITKDVVWPRYVSIPSPQPGLILPINSSPGVWAECLLSQGGFSERDLILPHPTKRGKLIFGGRILKHFIIDPPMARPDTRGIISPATTVPLLLPPPYPTDYTLLVFHKNFRNWVVEVETIRFSTTGYYRNDSYTIGGRKIYADKVIRLARVKPYQNRQFKFHRTYYPGHALLDALGML